MSRHLIEVPTSILRVGDTLYNPSSACHGTVTASITNGVEEIGFTVAWHKFDPQIQKKNHDVLENLYKSSPVTVKLFYDGYDPTQLMYRFGATTVSVVNDIGPFRTSQWIGIFPIGMDLSEIIQIMNSWYNDTALDVVGSQQQLIIWE